MLFVIFVFVFKTVFCIFRLLFGVCKFIGNVIKGAIKLIGGVIKGIKNLTIGFLKRITGFIFTPIGMYIVGYITGTIDNMISRRFHKVSIRDKIEQTLMSLTKVITNKKFVEIAHKIDKINDNWITYEAEM